MTEIQLTNIQFAELQLDNLVAKDKPYIESWSAGDVGSFNAILNAVDYDNEFTFNMRGWSRQRVKSGTGAMIEVNEMNADQLYHLFTCYLSGLPSGVVTSLGGSVVKANEFFKKVGIDAVRSYVAAYEDTLTDDLKRLVESHDLVESFGGVEMAKRYLDENLECEDSKTLRQAIADVESCMEVSSESN